MSSETTAEGREKPCCVMIALCESVVQDSISGKKVLYGLFNQLTVPSLPIPVGIVVIGSFGEGRGTWRLTLRIRDAKQRVVFQIEGDITFGNPVDVYDYVFRVQNITLNVEGVYDVDFLIDGEPISHRSFRVNLLPTPPEL